EFLPETFEVLEALSGKIGTSQYASRLGKDYAKIENISVDYAILERATDVAGKTQMVVVPAGGGWSDIGSLGAGFGLMARQAGTNVFSGEGHAIDAAGNFVSSPGKFVAVVGVQDLVVVDTTDALLICPRDRVQDVGKVVKWLEEQKKKSL